MNWQVTVVHEKEEQLLSTMTYNCTDAHFKAGLSVSSVNSAWSIKDGGKLKDLKFKFNLEYSTLPLNVGKYSHGGRYKMSMNHKARAF